LNFTFKVYSLWRKQSIGRAPKPEENQKTKSSFFSSSCLSHSIEISQEPNTSTGKTPDG